MLKSTLKAVGLLACMAWINVTSAADIGGINISSALGHPLKVEISLIELGKADKSTFVAKMASVDQFKGAGLDFPYSLPKLKFEVESRGQGHVYLKLTSTQPVNEPIVTLLIELSWPAGKLLREYTFFLDPVDFAAAQPKLTDVKPVEPLVPIQQDLPVVAAPPPSTPAPQAEVAPVAPVLAVPVEGQVAEVKPATTTNEVAKTELAASGSVGAEQAAVQPGEVLPAEPVKEEALQPEAPAATGESILVEKGDTLGRIADAVKPVDVSLERMLVAMYRANVTSFDAGNMNRIKAGKILLMPASDEISKVTQSGALKEIRAQVADWQDYRQKLAAAQTTSAERAPKQEVTGKIRTAVAEKAAVIKESAKEVLKLSKGESLGDKTVPSSGAKLKQEKITAEADDAAAKRKQLQEEKIKIAALENISNEASKLLELKGQPVPPVAVEEQKTPEATGLPAVSAVLVTEPVAAELDIMAMINGYWAILMEDPLLLGGGVAILLALVGLGFYMARRDNGDKKKVSKKHDEVGVTTGSWRKPVAPSADTGDFTVAAESMSGVASLDDVDPISEADLFLNFGRDTQAEEILKDALSKNPSNIQLKLKLLSIYVNRKDEKSFSKYAQEIKNSGDAAAWGRASVMGREIDPSNPIYGDAKGDVRLREPVKAEVDFDLGSDKYAESKPNSTVVAKDFKMDFDLSASQSGVLSKPVDLSAQFSKPSSLSKAKSSADVDATSILSREVVNSAKTASPMDFDVSGILPSDAKNIGQSTMMNIDISGILPGEVKKISQATSSMDFKVDDDFSKTVVLQGATANLKPASPSINFDDLVFDIPTSLAKASTEMLKAGSTPQNVEDKAMPFTIDFALSNDVETTAIKPSASNKLDMDFGDININLDEDMPPARADAEGKDEHWHEVATKLDLAKAYQEMGDADGAREILEEVIRDGDGTQRQLGEKLLQQITN